MEQLATQVIGALATVPVALIYVIAAIWVGIESDGIGVPVEPVMLFVGSLAAAGHISLPIAVLATGVGCVLLGTISFMLGRRFGPEVVKRVGRFVGLTPARADHLELWLRHRGLLGIILLRMTPLLRSFSSFICGTAEIAPVNFIIGTFVGSAVYSGIWIVLGNVLGDNYKAPLHFLDQLGPKGLLIPLGIIVVLFVAHRLAGRFAFLRMALHFHRHHPGGHASGPPLTAGALDA
ncbi:MAG TPA: DedA family protein [Ktedonobacterales bacterium]|nr:DedA family protein [Ktedonobacterales bacterium]